MADFAYESLTILETYKLSLTRLVTRECFVHGEQDALMRYGEIVALLTGYDRLEMDCQ